MQQWLDNEGCFLFGKYKDRTAEAVSKEDPQYLQWILDKVKKCCDEDRRIFNLLLVRRGLK